MTRSASDPPETEPLLQVTDMEVRLPTARGTVRAVDGVSLTLQVGRTLGLVGESGCGKTMLLRSIMGLTDEGAVRRGRVTLAGEDLSELGPTELRRYWGSRIALVLQNPMSSLNPVRRVGRQVETPLRLHRAMSRAAAARTAVELLGSVGIPDPQRRARQYPHQLSGGMRQRVAVAAALAGGPRLLLADEPTTALDVTVQAQILDLLDEQRRKRNMAMILVSHDLGVVARRSDTIAVMYAGQVVEQGRPRDVFARPRAPYTRLLLDAIPRLRAPRHRPLAAIAGGPPDLTQPQPGCRFAPRCPWVRDRCRAEAPPLVTAGGSGHQYRCWFPPGLDDDRAASAPVSQEGT